MTNRPFDELAAYRDILNEYMLTHRAPTFEGAYQYVVEKCDEQTPPLAPPHTSTVRRLLKDKGFKIGLVRS